MKKILSILGTITLIGTSTTSLVACDNIVEYTQEQLKELKKENKININGNTLEWMAPQEKPFNKVDNKWYFVIWKADKWIATKYKNNRYEPNTGWIIKDLINVKCRLMIRPNAIFGAFSNNRWREWDKDNGSYFKSVYRWEGNGQPKTLIIDPKTGKVTDWKEDKEDKEDK